VETGSFRNRFDGVLGTEANPTGGKPLSGMSLVASFNLSNVNWRNSQLDTYLKEHPGTGLVYGLADYAQVSGAGSAETVWKVGETTPSGWRKRFADYRAWALAGSYWATGQIDPRKLVLYVYAVPLALRADTETAARQALYAAGQHLPRDYTQVNSKVRAQY